MVVVEVEAERRRNRRRRSFWWWGENGGKTFKWGWARRSCMTGDSEFVQNFGLMQRTRGDGTPTLEISFKKCLMMEKETGLMRRVHRAVHIKGRKENDWEGWGLGAMVCWRPQRGGERGGSGLNTDGGMWRVRCGGWRRIDGCGGGVAICCFCCPVVKTVGSRVPASSLWTWTQPFLCLCVGDGPREKPAQTSPSISIKQKYLQIQSIAPNFISLPSVSFFALIFHCVGIARAKVQEPLLGDKIKLPAVAVNTARFKKCFLTLVTSF